MPTTIKLKNSVTTTNAPSSLAQGEVAINVTDKKVWVGNAATTPVQLLGTGADGSFTNLAYTGTLTGGTGVVNLGSGQFYKDASGNVGIGTSTSRGSAILTVAQAGATSGGISIDTTGGYADNNYKQLGFYSAAALISYIREIQYSAGKSDLAFGTYPVGGSATERMRIDSSGNVGIGTTSPSTPLNIVRNAAGAQKVLFSNNSSGSSAETAFSVSNGTAEGSLRVAGGSYGGYGTYTANNTLVYNDTSAITIMADNASNGIIKFATGGNSERMRIGSTGNLLVGRTSSTNFALLEVAGAIRVNNNRDKSVDTAAAFGMFFAKGATTVTGGAGAEVIKNGTGSEAAFYLISGITQSAPTRRFFDIVVTLGVNLCSVLNSGTSNTPATRTYTSTSENLNLSLSGTDAYSVLVTGFGSNEAS